MRRFWMFRSNLVPLEYYHQYTDLETFEKNCHDYYLLLPIWLLRQDYFDEVVIWRLTKNPKNDLVFNINNKKFIQRWVTNFDKTYDYQSPDISFFRGGFQEYDVVTRFQPRHFGKKLYLGAGRRQFAQYGGQYDAYLIEDERDFRVSRKCIPFYKTASPHIFYPGDSTIKWDICWPCNFTQLKYKGQEFFIKKISESKALRSLRIVHCGNKPGVGEKLAKKYKVTNIEFMGPIPRPALCVILNHSKFGLNMSNTNDGCPRVSTEVLMSGTPLLLRNTVRLLNYYKNPEQGVITMNDRGVANKIMKAMSDHDKHKSDVLTAIENQLSFHNTNQKNIKEWQKI